MDELCDRVIATAAEMAEMEAPANARTLCRLLVEQTLCYCRRADVPVGLELLIADMLAERFKEANGGGENVTSVKEGDTQVSFAARTYKQFANRKAELQGWRRAL